MIDFQVSLYDTHAYFHHIEETHIAENKTYDLKFLYHFELLNTAGSGWIKSDREEEECFATVDTQIANTCPPYKCLST